MTIAPWAEGLPSFERPPVVEVVVGVEFVPLPGLTTVKLVDLHRNWTSEFPQVQEMHAAPPADIQDGIHVSSALPPLRLWMLSEDHEHLLQIQNDRVILNWRKVKPDSAYPRYESLRERFADLWSQFAGFVAEMNVGDLAPISAEVTFVNSAQSPKGADDSMLLVDLFDGFPAGASDVSAGFKFPLYAAGSKDQGVQFVSARSLPDGSLSLELVAKTNVADSSTSAVLQSLDTSHRSGVLTFASLTSDYGAATWGRVQQ